MTDQGFPCPECPQVCGSPAGLGRHRSVAHGVVGRSSATRSARRKRALGHTLRDEAAANRDALDHLVPGLHPDIRGRLATFAAKIVAEAPGGVIVIGDTFGPQVVARRYIADIVAAAHEPLLVLTYDQLHRTRP